MKNQAQHIYTTFSGYNNFFASFQLSLMNYIKLMGGYAK